MEKRLYLQISPHGDEAAEDAQNNADQHLEAEDLEKMAGVKTYQILRRYDWGDRGRDEFQC